MIMSKPFSRLLSRPVFFIKLQGSSEKRLTQNAFKDIIENLTLIKNLALVHVNTVIDQVIDLFYDIKAVSKSMRQ